jgi:dimethylamine--corrinoid protein Co-methyltransferase
MKIAEAKKYVADRLKISIADLSDPVAMTEVRQDLQLGTMSPQPKDARGIEAKIRIAEALGVGINCVKRFKAKAGLLF